MVKIKVENRVVCVLLIEHPTLSLSHIEPMFFLHHAVCRVSIFFSENVSDVSFLY